MALQGTLEDFGIADIFQLIGQQKKTGILVASKKDNTVHIHFRDGCILAAEVQNRGHAERLGEMMLLAGLIQKDQLQKALEVQRKTLQKLGTIFLEQNAIKKSELDEFIYLQTKETIYKLFRWNQGTYEFHPQDVPGNPEFFQPISAEHILMDGFRIIDEWPAIRKKIGSFATIFEHVPGKNVRLRTAGQVDLDSDLEAAFSAFEGESGQSEGSGLSPNGERIYELVDGARDVATIIAFSRLGEFESCLALSQLVDQGLVQPATKVVKADTGGGAESLSIDLYQDYETPHKAVVSALPRLLYYGAFLAVVFVLLSYLGFGPYAGLFRSGRHAVLGTVVQGVSSDYQEARINAALDIYYLRFGYYPRNLDELVAAGLLVPKDLRYPWQDVYSYRSDGASYRLEKPFR